MYYPEYDLVARYPAEQTTDFSYPQIDNIVYKCGYFFNVDFLKKSCQKIWIFQNKYLDLYKISKIYYLHEKSVYNCR